MQTPAPVLCHQTPPKPTVWEHPTELEHPKRVAFVGLGPSIEAWVAVQLRKGEASPEVRGIYDFDEIWTLNRGARLLAHDLSFVMDDLRGEARHDPDYGQALMRAEKPIITSRAYDEFPASMAYPLEAVAQLVGAENLYFRNSVPYVLAYALFIGVKEIVLFGVDYDYPGQRVTEEGRANTEYWVGFCRARGMRVGVPSASTLLAANAGAWWYGYAEQPDTRQLGLDLGGGA